MQVRLYLYPMTSLPQHCTFGGDLPGYFLLYLHYCTDGLHPRALEILGSLGLTDPILREGAKVCEVTEWASSPEDGKLKRVASHRPGMQKMPRYPDTFNLAQGRLERILADDLINYSERGVLHLQKLVGLIIDETGSLEYPVKVEIQSEGGLRTVRAQFVVGADGNAPSLILCDPI